MKNWLKALTRKFRDFARHDSGAAIVLFALATVPMVAFVGMGTDTARAYLVKSRMSSALDAAGLAGGRHFFSPIRDAEIEMFFNANFPPGYMNATVSGPHIVVDELAERLTLTAEAQIPTTLMKVLGFDNLTVTAETEITRQMQALDVVIAMDMSGSMGSSSGSTTRIAAEDLADGSIIRASLDEVIETLASMPTPKILVVDLGPSTDIMGEAARLAEVCDAGARVILLGAVNDLHVYRDVLAAGVTDYLAKPFTYHEFSACLQRARPRTEPHAAQLAPVVVEDGLADAVCVIGVRGGVGASTIAANAAWFVADQLQKNVTLIDMDLTFGTQALILDVDPGGGLADAMREPGRMDELFVKRASVALGEKFRVMASETDPAKGDLADAEAFSGLLEYVRRDSELVIVDVPRAACVAHPEMLEGFSRIVLVAEPSLAAMRDSVRLSTLIGAVNPGADVSVVLARQGIAPREELSQKTFEEGSGLKIAATVPFDPKTAMRTEADGKCVLQANRRSKLGRALVQVTELIAGQAQKPATGLFAKFRRAAKPAQQTVGG